MEKIRNRVRAQLASLGAPIAVRLPNGDRIAAPDPRVTLAFSDWSAFAQLAARRIGAVGEAYVEGVVRIDGTMRDVFAAAAAVLPSQPIERDTGWWSRTMRRVQSARRHTLSKDERQIAFHYDVSDAFYELWLDARRVYSCAYFQTPDMGLEAAQAAKLDLICRKLMLQPGERFLDIGCGWGALLLWAAEHYDVQATGITLSRNQHHHVERLITERGLTGRVKVKRRDYRSLPTDQPFDKIASVGMCEHVGRANLPGYFAQLHALLAPGGLLLNHSITSGEIDQRQVGAGMGDFIEKYIFPGGDLQHVSHLLREMAGQGLEMVDTENLRPHYARTLWAWSDALEAQLGPALEALIADPVGANGAAGGAAFLHEQRQGASGADAKKGRGASGGEAAVHNGTPDDAGAPSHHSRRDAERILRAYRLYLAGSAMSFERGWIALHQVLATRPNGDVESGSMRGAQSVYRFLREPLYNLSSPCSTDSNPKPLPTS